MHNIMRVRTEEQVLIEKQNDPGAGTLQPHQKSVARRKYLVRKFSQ